MRYESVATIRRVPSTRETRTPVSSGRPSSWEAARTTWRTASARAVSESCGGRVARLAHRRELHHRVGLEFEGGPGRGDRDVVPVVGEGHRPRLQTPHDVGGEPGRNDTTPVVDPDHLVGHLDRQVEVGSCHAQQISRACQEQAQKHRGRAATASDGAAGRCQHLDEHVAFGSELHRRQSFPEVPQPFIAEGEVYETCKGSKACGLWTTYHPPCSVAGKMSPPQRGEKPARRRRPAPAARPGDKGTAVPRLTPANPQPLPLANHSRGDVGPERGGFRPSPHGSSG